jgi:hypothetical protein
MWRRLTRILAGVGSMLAGWVAVDGVLSNPVGDGAGGTYGFLLYWILPFAVAAAFLGWFALRGDTSAAAGKAKGGCLGALALGGGVFLLYATSPLVLPWDPLTGAVHALLYAPLAGALGLLIGTSAAALRLRR